MPVRVEVPHPRVHANDEPTLKLLQIRIDHFTQVLARLEHVVHAHAIPRQFAHLKRRRFRQTDGIQLRLGGGEFQHIAGVLMHGENEKVAGVNRREVDVFVNARVSFVPREVDDVRELLLELRTECVRAGLYALG